MTEKQKRSALQGAPLLYCNLLFFGFAAIFLKMFLPYSKMFKICSISDAQKQEGNAFSPIFCAD